MSGYGDRDNSEYIEGNRGDANYIDSNPTRGEHAGNKGSGGMMDKIKGAMGMGKDKDSSDYDSSRSGDYGSNTTRDKYSSGDNYDSSNTNTDTYGSGRTGTGRDTTDTYGSTGRDTSDTYGSTGRDTTDTYGSTGRDTYGSGTTGTTGTTGLGSDSYGSTGNTTGQFGVGNNTSSFTNQPIGSTKGGDAFANKAYDGQRTIDDFTSGTTGTGASNLTSRTGDDNYGQGNTYGSSGRDTTDTYGSTGRGTSDTYGSTGRDTTDTYGSSGLGRDTTDTYGSTGRDTTDTYGSTRREGEEYEEGKHHKHHGEKKEGMMDKAMDKMGMRTNADAYDEDRNVRGVDSRNY